MIIMIDRYIKYFIICIIFIGVLASVSTFSTEMVKTLVKSGAELSKNDFGLSAIDSASDNNNSDVLEFLVKYYDDLDKIY